MSISKDPIASSPEEALVRAPVAAPIGLPHSHVGVMERRGLQIAEKLIPVAPPAPPTEPSATRSFFARNSLQIAGILNLIGDVGFLMTGIGKVRAATTPAQRTAGIAEAVGGGLYTLGGLNLTVFGHVDERKPIEDITEKTAAFLTQQAGPLPATSGLGALHTSTNLANTKTPSFFYRNAAQNTLGAYTLGAGALLTTGITQFRAKESGGSTKLAYGITSLAVKLASLLIPEKSKDDTEAKSSSPFVQWIREKPLRILGYGSIITDSLLAVTAYNTRKTGKNASWEMVTAGTYILADSMMAISSKDKNNVIGTFSAADQQRVEGLVAETIAQQPKEKQAHLVNQVSRFLARQSGMPTKPTEIAIGILNQMSSETKPWASRLTEELATDELVR